MHDRLLPINENEPTPDTDNKGGDSGRCGPRVLLCAVPGVALVWLLVWLSDGGGDDYGLCTATQHSRPNNAMPPLPSRAVPKSCPQNPSRGCHGNQPDDPECCVGAACCRCSTDSSSYNPTPKLFTDFHNFSFDLHVVCATEKAGGLLGFPVRPNKLTGNEGNMRLVGVALPEGTPPAGGWPVVVFFAGSDNARDLKAVLEPDKHCNIENKGCGMNVTSPMLTQCHAPDGDPNMPPGFHLYPTYKPDGSTAWIDYAWRNLDFVSNYQAQRMMRRLLLNGFAVVHPQTWGLAGWCVTALSHLGVALSIAGSDSCLHDGLAACRCSCHTGIPTIRTRLASGTTLVGRKASRESGPVLTKCSSTRFTTTSPTADSGH